MFDGRCGGEKVKKIKIEKTTKKQREVGAVRVPNTGCVLLKPDLNPAEAEGTNC